MENHQHTNPFDAMLKQSLEGSQMPVPAGVWESVGSSIGVNAVVATKVVSLKLIILKTVAGLVFTTGAVYGVYEFINSNKKITNKKQDSQVSVIKNPDLKVSDVELPFERDLINEHPQLIINDTVKFNNKPKFFQADLIADSIREAILPNGTQIFSNKDLVIKADKIIDKSIAKIEQTKISIPAPKKETAVSDVKDDISNSDKNYSANDIIIPNVFTPNELDGQNDCYQIIIENESKFILQIFSTNNQKVFETTDKNKCWDGKNSNTGQMCPKGIYIYKFLYELKSGYKRTERGQLNLL